MINDGRTRYCSVAEDGSTFSCWYRPATGRERRYLRRILRKLDKVAGNDIAIEWVESRITYKSMADFSSFRQWTEAFPRACERLFTIILGLAEDSTGQIWAKIEEKANQNLADGIVLLRTNKAIANRACESCLKYWYSEATGQILTVNSTGEKRLREGPAPCRTERGCPKGTPEEQKSLTPDNRRALTHYLECEAIGRFPDDAHVRECAVMCRRELNRKIVK